MTRAGASPATAPVAVTKLDAAALGNGSQRLNKGTQDILDVVFEEEALMLKCVRGEEGYTHTD